MTFELSHLNPSTHLHLGKVKTSLKTSALASWAEWCVQISSLQGLVRSLMKPCVGQFLDDPAIEQDSVSANVPGRDCFCEISGLTPARPSVSQNPKNNAPGSVLLI